MPQNVLLHFPIVDLVCLQRSVRDHTRRIVKLIHEHNEYINKCKVFTKDKESTPFPLYITEVPNELTSSEDILLSEGDIFSVGIERSKNHCTVRSDIDKKGDSVINQVCSSELNSLYRDITSDLERRNSEEDFGNLTTLSCPIRFPSEEKPIFLPGPDFETFLEPPKALGHNIKNSDNNYSELVENDMRKIEFSPSSVIKSVKVEQHSTKMEPSNYLEEAEDEIVVLEVKEEKKVEVITIDDEEDDNPTPQVGPIARQVSVISKPIRSTFETSENLSIPPEDLTPPSLTPEVSEPPYLSPEIMEPILTPESSQPPLIFPEIDPPLWSFSASSPMASSDDIQPPVLTPEVRDPNFEFQTDKTMSVLAGMSRPSLISSEVLPSMLSPPEVPECSSLSSGMSSGVLITLDSDSSNESVADLNPRQKSIPVIVSPGTSHMTSPEAEQTMITPKKTNDITKIKGWKKKHFAVEKHETAGSLDFSEGEDPSNIVSNGESVVNTMLEIEGDGEEKTEEESTENAFVSENLDRFLQGNPKLKIDYKVPYLYAEVGIKLTKDELASRPNLSEEELENFVTKYCIPVSLNVNDDLSVDSECEEKIGTKRKLKQSVRSSKARKLEANNNSACNVRIREDAQTLYHSTESIQTKVTSQRTTSSQIETTDLNANGFDGHESNKVLGLALYPGPKAPLPRLVQRHLDKIRSYQLKIDRNWANFAVSALIVPKRSKYIRMILPVQYSADRFSGPRESTAIPNEVNEVLTNLVDTVCNDVSQQSSEEILEAQDSSPVDSQMIEKPQENFRKRQKTVKETVEEGANVKKCKISVSKVPEQSRVWCMEHKRFNCHPCGFDPVTQERRKSQPTEDNFPNEFFVMSTPLKTNQDIASFLTQKLRNRNWKDVVVNNIEYLKTIVPNALEFIKLSLVRDSFLSNHISIWYLKPHTNRWNQSRAFLTFSKTSPIPSAIRLRADLQKFEETVPKIIKDMMKLTEKSAKNEYVIMLCNGKVWELHGTLRYATPSSRSDNFEKDCLKREEIFTPIYPPELEKISKKATKVIKEPSARWWVVDLTQKFTTIISKMDTRAHVMSRKYILNYVRMKFCGLLTLNKTKNRAIWVHIIPKLLPYVLIGPYKFSEPNGLLLRQGSKVIPFSYSPNLCAPSKFPLKDCIDSVIAQVKEQERELRGMWLCDRQQVDKTCFLEIFTVPSEHIFSMLEYNIDVEHGYSLKSLINSQPLVDVKSKVPRTVPKVKVYLYFDLFELGFVAGNLFQDDTVMAHNPLNNRFVTIPSRVFGDWFISVIQEKIRFVPNDLSIRWFVTKHMEDLKERKSFDVRYLEGSYVICLVGPRSELKIMETKAYEENSETSNDTETPLEKKMREREEAITHLKELDCVLNGSPSAKIDVGRLLNKAEDEIKELESLCTQQSQTHEILASRRRELGSRLIQLLDSLYVDDAIKMLWFNDVKPLLTVKDSNEFEKHFKEALLRCKFGRLHLILNGERELLDPDNKTTKRQKREPKNNKPDCNRGNTSMAGSVTDIPASVRSGNERKENPKTTKEKTQETSTISSIEDAEVTKIIIGGSSIYLVSKKNNNDTENAASMITNASTSVAPGQMPKFDTILFSPLTSGSRRKNKQQSSTVNEQVLVPHMSIKPPVLTSNDMIQLPVRKPSNAKIQTSQSRIVLPQARRAEHQEPINSDVEAFAQSLKNLHMVSEPISLESTSTSSDIFLVNNSEDDGNNESNEFMLFDSEWGSFVTYGVDQ